MKVNTVANAQDERQWVTPGPTCRQRGLQVVVLVLAYNGVEDQCADVLSLRIGADTDIEIRR